ncbi:MAG: hypothetical protein AB2417_16515 [Clostridiaceae bacterium]
MKKNKYIIVFILSLFIVLIGFLKVSSALPTFIKNKSNFKVYFSEKPFDLTLETKNYIIYFNEKSIDNIQNSVHETFNQIVQWSKDKLESSTEGI